VLGEVIIQTVNGFELEPGWALNGETGFIWIWRMSLGSKNIGSPPAQTIINRDVERFHDIIQDKFYTLAQMRSRYARSVRLI